MKLYKFEVIETKKYIIEVEASDREKADELALDALNGFAEPKREHCANVDIAYQNLGNDWSLISAEDIEEEPADEDLVREGSPVVEE